MNDRALLTKIFLAGCKAVNGYKVVSEAVKLDNHYIYIAGKQYNLHFFKKIFVIGAGKASFEMARALDNIIGQRIHKGIVITKYGHGGHLNHIRVFEASHPLPDANSIKATKQLINLSKEVDPYTLVIVLLSGGASSLLVAPDGISLANKIKATSLLLKAGASIDELNVVRKHLSLIKGGKLAQIFYPAKMITLIISDVIGNKLDIIGSGPTVEDSSSPRHAIDIIDRYKLRNKMPAAVLGRLKDKIGMHEQTLKSHVRNIIIADNKKAIHTCKKEAMRSGLEPVVLTTQLHGEAKEVAHVLASIACEIKNKKRIKDKKVCIISGGETTVTVNGNGKGGRNQELALSFAMDINGKGHITLLSAGTDGTDGPTDAAGAIVDETTINRINQSGLNPLKYLSNNDSYTILHKVDALLKTGTTGTNVMDIQLILV